MCRFVQLALDLFGPDGALPPAAPAPALTQPGSDPAQPLPGAIEPAHFVHPRANRQLRLCEAQVAYELRRGRRRTIGMQVGPDGLVVSAPRWVALGDIEAALREKASWIVRKLGEMRERQQRLEAARIHWRDGVDFPYLGEPLRVALDPTQALAGSRSLRRSQVPVQLRELTESPAQRLLHIGLPLHASAEQIRDAVQAWLMRQAQIVFAQRLDHYAPRLGVRWRKLALSSAGTRWGSASSEGTIRLNWRLIHFRLSVIDYVVAHELSHLRVMDHSPRFWETVRSVVPDYQVLRSELRDEALPRWY
jgi:hypothetical protein